MIKIAFYHIFWFLSYFGNMIKKKPVPPPCFFKLSTKTSHLFKSNVKYKSQNLTELILLSWIVFGVLLICF